jgi:hypothetical protein
MERTFVLMRKDWNMFCEAHLPSFGLSLTASMHCWMSFFLDLSLCAPRRSFGLCCKSQHPCAWSCVYHCIYICRPFLVDSRVVCCLAQSCDDRCTYTWRLLGLIVTLSFLQMFFAALAFVTLLGCCHCC